jgi:hypothetical protein
MDTFVIERLCEAADGLMSAKHGSEDVTVQRHCVAALREVEKAVKLAATLTEEDVELDALDEETASAAVN